MSDQAKKRWKKIIRLLVLNGIAIVFFLVAIEFILRLTVKEKPRVLPPASAPIQVFMQTTSPEGEAIYVNRLADRTLFSKQDNITASLADGTIFQVEKPFPPSSFKVKKSPDAKRIFIFGSSPMYSFWSDGSVLNFGEVLQKKLIDKYPQIQWEVINCSNKAFDQDSIFYLMNEVKDYQADLFFIYLGNVSPTIYFNFDRHLILDSSMKSRVLLTLATTKIYKCFLERLFFPPGRPVQGQDLLTMARTYGNTDTNTLAIAKRNLQEIIRRKTEKTISKMSDLCRGSATRLAFYTIATNLDISPVISGNTPHLSLKTLQTFNNTLNTGKNYLWRGEYSKAEKELQAAIRLNPLHAEAHFQLGKAFKNQKKWKEAAIEMQAAARLDLAGDRLDSLLNPALEKLKKESNLSVIDIYSAVENDRGGNNRMFTDQTHFSLLGMEAIAATTIDWMEKSKIISEGKYLPPQ